VLRPPAAGAVLLGRRRHPLARLMPKILAEIGSWGFVPPLGQAPP
jgi:hypothetical protein